MLAAATIVQLIAAAVWGVVAGAFASYGAFFALLILNLLWSEFSGSKLTKAVKLTAFLFVGVLFCGLGGLFAPLAFGGYVAVGMYSDDSTSKAIDVSFFIFFAGTILFYLVAYLLEFFAKPRSKSLTENEEDYGGDNDS